MFNDVINNLITALRTITDFDADSVVRGEPGKINTIKNNACLVMPDFEPPRTFGFIEGELAKQLPFTATCFVAVAKKKTLEDAESDVMDLAHKVILKAIETETVVGMNGNFKYYKWEFTNIEWGERSASLAVIALEFTINLQI